VRTVRRISLVVPIVLLLSGLPVAQLRTKPHAVLDSLAMRAPGHIKAPGDFRMVGVSWDAGSPAPTNIRLRTSTNGSRWTHWTKLDVSDVGPDRTTGEAAPHATEPLWVGHARFADVRFDDGGAQGVKLDVVDPGADPTTPIATASASPGAPAIITRAQWGADESIRKKPPHYADPTQMMFVHHTATTNSYAKSDSAAIVRSIYVYHVKTNGWDDIGYNFLVDRYGQIFEGRYGGMTRSVIGAHTLGFNTHSSGVSVIGTFNSVGPPAAAMSALQRLIAWRMNASFINPAGHTTMTSGGNPRYPQGTKVTLNTISGHRDVYDTDCPGQILYNALPGMRSTVAALGDPKIYNPTLSSPVITPNGDGVADAETLTAYFSSSVNWSLSVLDSAGTSWFSKSGSGISLSATWNGKNAAGVVAPHDYYRFVIKASNGHGTMNTAQIQFAVWSFPDGTVFVRPDNWVGILMNGKLRHPVAPDVLHSQYPDSERFGAPATVNSVYPSGGDLGFRDGILAKDGTGTYLIADGQRHPISSATMIALGFSPSAVISTTSKSLAPTPQGSTVASGSYPNGSAIYSSNGGEAMYVSGLPHPFITKKVRSSYQITDIQRAGPADMDVTEAQAQTPLGFHDGSLIEQSGTSTIYVIADGTKHMFRSMHEFTLMGYKTSNVQTVTAAEFALNPNGSSI